MGLDAHSPDFNDGGKVSAARAPIELPVDEFNADHNKLGVHKFMGGQLTLFPPAEAPSQEREIRQLRRLNRYYVPMWVTNQWKGPNGRIVRTVHNAVGAEIIDPLFRRRPVKGLVYPAHPVYGITVRHPVVLFDILDGLTDKERNFGVLPRYEHITQLAVEYARCIDYKDRNKSPLERERERAKAEQMIEDKPKRDFANYWDAKNNDDLFDHKRAWEGAQRIFVPRSFGGIVR